MKSAIFDAVKSIKFIDTPIPKPGRHEILIRIEACAICTWEQRVYLGIKEVPFPFLGGHEIAAEIVELGEDVNHLSWSVGDKVVYGTNLACGDCYQCKIGNHQNCEHFDHTKQIPSSDYIGLGGFSEYLIAKPNHLFKYQGVDPIEASLIEPVSCCIHSVESSNVEFGDKVMVVGCGIMGLIHVQLALRKGATVIAVDMNKERLDVAKELGAHFIINNKTEDLKRRLSELSHGLGMQHIFNTTPISSVAQEMQQYLSINGHHVLYSSYYPDDPILISPDTLHKKATRIIGTANSNSRDFMRAVAMVEAKTLTLKPFISHVYPFDEIKTALDKAVEGASFRVVLDMNNHKEKS